MRMDVCPRLLRIWRILEWRLAKLAAYRHASPKPLPLPGTGSRPTEFRREIRGSCGAKGAEQGDDDRDHGGRQGHRPPHRSAMETGRFEFSVGTPGLRRRSHTDWCALHLSLIHISEPTRLGM